MTIELAGGELNDFVLDCVRDARKIVAAYWPISNFVATNALNGLEDLPFAAAMEFGRELLGSEGFLPLSKYREFFAKGRINSTDLATAIANTLQQTNLRRSFSFNTNGTKTIATEQIYQQWLLQNEKPQTEKGSLGEIFSAKLNQINFQVKTNKRSTQTLGETSFARDGQIITEVINKRMVRWCAAFLDEGQAGWQMPGREQGFYKSWRDLAAMDSGFRYYTGKALAKKLQELPSEAAEALGLLLQELEIPRANWREYLMRHLAQLPGWASLIRWREEHDEALSQQQYPIDLVEYLAVRVFYEVLLIQVEGNWTRKHQQTNPAEKSHAELINRLVSLAESFHLTATEIENLAPENFKALAELAVSCNTVTQQAIWQEAYERHFREQFLQKLSANQDKAKPASIQTASNTRPAAQAMFCIDVRSEGLRRQLENLGTYQTYGIAGFFGVPMLYQPFGSDFKMVIGPALIKPTQVVTETPIADDTTAVKKNVSFNRWRYSWHELMHGLKQSLMTPYAFVEMVGLFSGISLVGRTLAPVWWHKTQQKLQAKLAPKIAVEPSLLATIAENEVAAEEAAKAVGGVLRSIGLTKNFARLVLISGHGSETENNHYASGLDCGACGGNHGDKSALVAAALLNNPQIRKILAKQGLAIPADTFFLAGEHNTTTDIVSILNEDELPSSHITDLMNFKRDLATAGKANAHQRSLNLPGADSKNLEQRACDWSQVRPEWGLAGNAAFICGRRALTANLDLESRAFLHSYDQSQDPDGAILENIMTAPVVVGEWINMQYYLSSVDNQKYGSSTKLLHTVVGQVGVMQGKQSDLLLGLPQQSVMFGDELYHEPLRLMVVIEATTSRISQIIAKHALLQKLTRNQWINLVAYDAASNIFYELTPNGDWLKVTLEDEASQAA